MTKILRATTASVFCMILLALCALWLSKRLPAQALGACSASFLSGPYSYAVNGTQFVNGNLAGFYSVVGVLTADGNGSVSGTDTVSENGIVQAGRTYSGTYSVQSNCSGTVTLSYSNQVVPFAIAISANGEQVYFLQTTNGAVAAGTATRQQVIGPLLRRR